MRKRILDLVAAWGAGLACAGCGFAILWLFLEQAGLSLPVAVLLVVALTCGLIGGLEVWRQMPRRVVDNAQNHSLCGKCWSVVVPTRSPPQLPLTERHMETCCRCGTWCFDGIYYHRAERYTHCDHQE
jgi:hypothetical protein